MMMMMQSILCFVGPTVGQACPTFKKDGPFGAHVKDCKTLGKMGNFENGDFEESPIFVTMIIYILCVLHF